jgi:hypothetical protein
VITSYYVVSAKLGCSVWFSVSYFFLPLHTFLFAFEIWGWNHMRVEPKIMNQQAVAWIL